MSCKFYVEYEYYLEIDTPTVGSKLINTNTSSLKLEDFDFILEEISEKECVYKECIYITSITKIFEN